MKDFFQQRIRSFGYALQGMGTLFVTQVHARIHLVATVAVVAAGCYWEVSRIDWLFLWGSIILVWVAEALNTAIEFLTDLVSPDYHPLAGKAKDTAAAAVLMAAIGAIGVGCIVFWPYLTK
ncbi:MAG: diacylglycerol kinase family protein [Saprospiraceae bacterium]